jgi:hypothetical protein
LKKDLRLRRRAVIGEVVDSASRVVLAHTLVELSYSGTMKLSITQTVGIYWKQQARLEADRDENESNADTDEEIDYPRQGSNLRPFAPEAM